MKSSLLALLFLSSCASSTGVHKEIEESDISAASILDLSVTSYIKGCVFGRKDLGQEFNLEFCKKSSTEHKKTIKEILYGQESTTPSHQIMISK